MSSGSRSVVRVSALITAMLAACTTSESAGDEAALPPSPAVATEAPAALALSLASGPAALGDGDSHVATIADGELVILSLSGGDEERHPLSGPVTSLVADGTGGFWLIGVDRVDHWREGEVVCGAGDLGDGLTVLSTDPERGIVLGRELYVDGSGVHGEHLDIDQDCAVDRSPLTQPAVTAVHALDDGRSLAALGAKYDAGPTRLWGPVLQLLDEGQVIREQAFLPMEAAVDRVTALVSRGDRALAIADDGQFAIHQLPSLKELATGRLAASTDRAIAIDGQNYAIAGAELIDLASGRAIPLLAEGTVQDVTADQSWWLIRTGDAVELRSGADLTAGAK